MHVSFFILSVVDGPISIGSITSLNQNDCKRLLKLFIPKTVRMNRISEQLFLRYSLLDLFII